MNRFQPLSRMNFRQNFTMAGTGEGFIANQVKIGDDFKVSYDSSEGSPVFFYVQ